LRRIEEWAYIFTYKLELEDGTPADRPTLHSAASAWRPGDTIPLGRDRALRVVGVRTAAETDEESWG
jgi:hypothetical protein